MVTFRPLSKQYIPLLESAIASEPYHRDWLKLSFFFHPASMTVLGFDDQGPMVFLRMKPVGSSVHLFAQFVCRDRLRMSRVMIEGFKTVKKQCKEAGATQIIIESFSPDLIRFCEMRLGFKPLGNNHYVLELQDTHV